MSRSQNINDEIGNLKINSAHNSQNSLNEFYSEEEYNDNENNDIKCIKEQNSIIIIENQDSQKKRI